MARNSLIFVCCKLVSLLTQLSTLAQEISYFYVDTYVIYPAISTQKEACSSFTYKHLCLNAAGTQVNPHALDIINQAFTLLSGRTWK